MNRDMNKRLDALEQTYGQNGHGPLMVVRYTRDWRGTSDTFPAWDTYRAAIAVHDDEEAIDAVIEEICAEAIAANAPSNWILRVQTEDDGVVAAAGPPWWPETERAQSGWSFTVGWRRFPKQS